MHYVHSTYSYNVMKVNLQLSLSVNHRHQLVQHQLKQVYISRGGEGRCPRPASKVWHNFPDRGAGINTLDFGIDDKSFRHVYRVLIMHLSKVCPTWHTWGWRKEMPSESYPRPGGYLVGIVPYKHLYLRDR